jgi:hypothetical protein
MTVAIYSDNGGVPGTAISPVLQLQGGNNRIVNGGYNTFIFESPVPVSGTFHVVVGSTNYNYTYFTVPCVENRANGYSTVSAYYSGWVDLGELAGLYTSMNIIPEFTYTTAELTTPVLYNKKNIEETEETIEFTTTGHSWTAATSESWIHLSAASGTVTEGAGSVSYTVDENEKQDIRKGIIRLNVAGTAFKVFLFQAGAAPVDVAAASNEEGSEINVTWTHEVPHYKPGDEIFDDAESYPAWTETPTGYYPWSYIDGDGEVTYASIPASFIVLDNTLDEGVEAHSGTNFFAAISATAPVNDWIISPELGFTEPFTFSFWAKSLTNDYNGGERFRVAYSTGDKTEADFTNVLTAEPYVIPPLEWAQYSYTVPADAKYVAINCVTEDEFIFMVDDIYIGTGTAPAAAPAQTTSKKAAGTLTRESLKAARAAALGKPVVSNAKDLVPLTHKDGTEAVAIVSLPALKSDVQLRSAAAEAAPEEALQWHNGSPYYIYGNVNGGHIEAAVRFAPEDLVFYDEATIKAVEIPIYNSAENLTLNIRKGNEIIHSQPIEDIDDLWVSDWTIRVELTEAVTIDASEDYFIGYAFDQAEGSLQDVAVLIADAGPAVAGKGDLYSYNGAAFSPAGSGNWLITTYVEPAILEVTFNVYKNGELLAEGLTEQSYTDTEEFPVNARASYTVTAVYGKPALESTESEAANVYSQVVLTYEGETEFCDGEELELSVPEVEGYASYQWYKDSELLADATGNSYTVTASGAYSLQVTTEEGWELDETDPVTVTVYPVPQTPVINLVSIGGSVTLVITNPEEGVLYQWYLDETAIGEPTTEDTYIATVTGDYYVVATNANECTGTSNGIAVTVVHVDDIFEIPTDPVSFAGSGSEAAIPFTITDPDNYISKFGLSLHINAPAWITSTVADNTITFVAGVNTTNALRTGTIQVWYGRSGSSFDPNSGYEIAVSQKAVQTISFEAPEVLILEDGTYQLSATATSGLAVSFSLRSEDATIAAIGAGDVLSLLSTGEIIVTASVASNDVYEAAENAALTITIRSTVGIVDIVQGKDLAVYPNPALRSSTFYVSTGLDETTLRGATIDIYSSTGALVHRQKVTGKLTEVSLSAPGTYFVRLKGHEATVIIK